MNDSRPLHGVLFDLDGTLVDSAADLQATLNRLLPEYGLPPLGLDQVKSMIGDGVAKLVERAFAASGGDMTSGSFDESLSRRSGHALRSARIGDRSGRCHQQAFGRHARDFDGA